MDVARPEFVPDPDLSREEMESLQREIAAAARFEDDLSFDPATVSCVPDGGTDLTDFGSGSRGSGTDRASPDPDDSGSGAPVVVGVDQAFVDDRAVSAIVAVCDGEVVERAHGVTEPSIPYIPGLLSFREGGSILAAFENLSVEPDLGLFDGSGRIHFRAAGLATHVGVTLDLPSVGVAKSLLCGRVRGNVEGGLPAGERVPIEADGRVEVGAESGEVIGYAVQTRQFDSPNRHVNPLYVSPGHRVSAGTAADLALSCAAGYKLPEPIRLADAHADEVKSDLGG